VLINVTENELITIGKGLSLLPWIEVNDLLMKLSQQQQASKAAAQVAAKQEIASKQEPKVINAPYGLKKDGTPAKRRGRKPTKRKTRQ